MKQLAIRVVRDRRSFMFAILSDETLLFEGGNTKYYFVSYGETGL